MKVVNSLILFFFHFEIEVDRKETIDTAESKGTDTYNLMWSKHF